MKTLGVYIHIPFCMQKCLYCDFPSYTHFASLYNRYIAALCREIADKGGFFSDYAVDSIYIGGGTPTVLAVEQLIRIIDCLRAYFTIVSDAEISIEANPGTINIEKLLQLKTSGINRISIGIQSFHDRTLQQIGRIHTATEAVAAVKMANVAGFENISIDLMYGLPEQTFADVETTLAQAITLPVRHISFYGLKVEEGTAFAEKQKFGLLRLPDEEVEEAMYDRVCYFLPRNRFLRYEVSNFAMPGGECRHNLKYWRYQPYIGFGAAAYSFIDGTRSGNTVDVEEYISCIEQGVSSHTFEENVDDATAMAEFSFLALRTVAGLDTSVFHARFQQDFSTIYRDVLPELCAKNLLEIKGPVVFLTETGMKYGNRVFASFLPDIS